ncbi:ankyrin repeat domain-containing protein, partial [Clostridium sp.]|uniref:ankyrin repeat domain-containing protein n=1 Tax=Clostridium sp. TaxID=1506 RepID=UPI00261C307E
ANSEYTVQIYNGKDFCLFGAIHNNDNKKLTELLENGANPNFQDKNGNNVFLTAIAYGKCDIIKTLIKYGANINTKNTDGASIIYMAILGVEYGDDENIVQLLVDAGVDIKSPSTNFKTPLDYTINELNNIYEENKKQGLEKVKRILSNKEIDSVLNSSDGNTGIVTKKDLEDFLN